MTWFELIKNHSSPYKPLSRNHRDKPLRLVRKQCSKPECNNRLTPQATSSGKTVCASCTRRDGKNRKLTKVPENIRRHVIQKGKSISSGAKKKVDDIMVNVKEPATIKEILELMYEKDSKHIPTSRELADYLFKNYNSENFDRLAGTERVKSTKHTHVKYWSEN